jgi:lipopolysaccharide export system protein LptC
VTTISFADGERGSAFPVRSRRSDGERTYRRAIRHSRRVRRLRGALLVLIGLVLAGLVVDNYLPPIGGLRLPVEIGKLVIRGTKITMQQPHLTGFTSDARAYEFTANAAAQDITKPDLVELQQIRANMELADKSIVHMWADTGLYNMKTDMLILNDNIRLVSSTGYEARLSQADVDMKQGNVVSDSPVWVKMLDGFLNAKRLEIVDRGDILRFTDVTMTLQSGSQDTKAGQQ